LSKNNKENKGVPEDKEPLSRVSRHQKKSSKKKRRVFLVVVLVIGAVLAVGAAFNIPYINVAREAGSWLGDRFSGSDSEAEPVPDYLYFTDPETGRKMSGEVSTLMGLYRIEEGEGEQRIILDLVLLTYDKDGGVGEIYMIPETSVAYNASGEQTDLRRALQEEGGEDLLRSTVSNLSGSEVDYLLLVEFWEAVKLVQGMGLPPVTLADKTVLVNPLNEETDFLVAGQEIGDSDRLILYLMATDYLQIWEAFSQRLERAREYLPEAMSWLRPVTAEDMEEMLSSLGEDYTLDPAGGSVDEDRSYLASMLKSFSDLEKGELAVRAVPAVEVLNGCGVPDLGKKVGEQLNSLGVPVAGTAGNAKVVVEGEEVNDFTHEVSTIVYRSEDARVEAFARYLGILLSIEDVKFEPGPETEIVIIAGRDLAV
jgi:hypothetical protein